MDPPLGDPQGTTASVDIPLSTSLPTTSPLDAPTGLFVNDQRANSELGHYPDLQEQRDGRQGVSPERLRRRDQHRERKLFHPTLNTVASTPNTPRPGDQEPLADAPRSDVNARAKISGPLGGTVIPAGYKFGGKDATAESNSSAAERREKAKSRSFWGFGKNGGL
jgi:RalA-binding protein 1